MTSRAERWNIVRSAVAALAAVEAEAWRTHLQKIIFFAEEWRAVPPRSYEFVIHRFGPYSFDLDRDIAEMHGFGVLERKSQYRLGVSYSLSGDAPSPDKLRPLAEWLGNKTVHELEVLATTEFVRNRDDTLVIKQVRELKPHVSREAIQEALTELDTVGLKIKEAIAAEAP